VTASRYSGSSHSADVGGNTSSADAGRHATVGRWRPRREVADPGAVVDRRIGVDHLAPATGRRQAQPVATMFAPAKLNTQAITDRRFP